MTRQKIGIIVVDDHRRVHQALTEMTSFLDDIEILAHGSNGAEAIDLCDRYQPDLILMDIVMPVMDGVEATRQIMVKHPDVKILALSSFDDQDAMREMLASGAVGYLLKNGSMEHLEHTIRTAIEGNSILSPKMVQALLTEQKNTSNFHLSRREKEVLRHFANGLTNAEIASELTISNSTVKFHITNILSKLGAETRAEALVIAAKNNLV